MSEKNWARIWEIFTEARDMDPAARAHLLEDLPPEIANEVRTLIDEEIAQPSGPAPDARYGRYALIESIGRGGMGEVFSARDTELGRIVAIKFLNMRTAVVPEAMSQLVTEAQTASALNHPNLITVHEILRHDSGIAVVSELVKGQPFARVLRRGAASPTNSCVGRADGSRTRGGPRRIDRSRRYQT